MNTKNYKWMNFVLPFVLFYNGFMYFADKEFWFGSLIIVCYSIGIILLWYMDEITAKVNSSDN